MKQFLLRFQIPDFDPKLVFVFAEVWQGFGMGGQLVGQDGTAVRRQRHEVCRQNGLQQTIDYQPGSCFVAGTLVYSLALAARGKPLHEFIKSRSGSQ